MFNLTPSINNMTNNMGNNVNNLPKILLCIIILASSLTGCQSGSPSVDSLIPSKPPVASGFPEAPPSRMKSAVVWGNDSRTVNSAILWLQRHGVSVYGPSVLQQALTKESANSKIAVIDEGAVLNAAKGSGAEYVVFADRVGDSRPPMVSVRGIDVSSGRIIMSGNAHYESTEQLPTNSTLSILTDQALMSAWGIHPVEQ